MNDDASLIDQLAQHGYYYQRDFLPADELQALREELLQRWHAGEFESANQNPALPFEQKDLRTDQVCTLDADSAGPAQAALLARIEQLRLRLNDELELGLQRFEGQFTVYPAGSYYRRHLDSFRGQRQRLITLVLYLNPDWHAEDGGALRLYQPLANGGEQSLDILPHDGTLALFMSETIPHEVLDTQRQRLGIVGWYRVRG